jgi:hypothetical protein
MLSHSSIYILNSEQQLNNILNVGIIEQIMYCISAYVLVLIVSRKWDYICVLCKLSKVEY